MERIGIERICGDYVIGKRSMCGAWVNRVMPNANFGLKRDDYAFFNVEWTRPTRWYGRDLPPKAVVITKMSKKVFLLSVRMPKFLSSVTGAGFIVRAPGQLLVRAKLLRHLGIPMEEMESSNVWTHMTYMTQVNKIKRAKKQ